MDVLHKL